MAPGSDASGKDADGARPVHIDWDRAVLNHHTEDKLSAFLLEYPGELRRSSMDMQTALANNDMERLLEAVSQVKGSASYVAALTLNNLARDLVEAIEDEKEKDNILSLAAETTKEMEAVEKEILDLKLAGTNNAGEATPLAPPADDNGGRRSCCDVM